MKLRKLKLRKLFALTFCLALMTAMVFGCATAQKETAAAEAQADWKFHDIVDVDFVKQYVKVPPVENVMIIDARPKRAKYDKGHIPSLTKWLASCPKTKTLC